MSAGSGAPVCAYCGAPLPRGRQRFCSHRCGHRWWNDARNERTSARLHAQRQALALACLDCKAPLVAPPHGGIPKRCKACKAAADLGRIQRLATAHNARTTAAVAARRARRRCADCTRPLGPPPHRVGKVPKRCPECKRTHDRERQRRRDARRRGARIEARRRRRWPLLWGGA